MQSAVVDLIVNAIYASNVGIEQPVILLAQDFSIDGNQMPLPSNQWILEFQDMHNRALTALQRLIVDYARGPGSPAAQKFMTVPSASARALCGLIRAKTNQRFR